MSERRSVRGLCRSISATLFLLSVTAAPCAAAPALYGLVIGIDDYVGTANDLDGAVNDANDISRAIARLGAGEVVRLFNDEASKERIAAEWKRLVGQARAGDTIIFTYAGHGSQEPEPPGRRDEADGKNENFLLGRYRPTGPGTKERIVDDEIFQWMKMADDKKIKVILVADSCHSGGMERSASAAGVKFRQGRFAALADDRLAFPPSEFATLTETDFNHITFVGAVAEDKLAPEITIEGQKRGALSWAFSRALEGRADKNGDGQVSELELLGYIVPAVHALVESQQTPQVLPLRARSTALVTLRDTDSPAPRPESGDDLKLKLAVEGNAPASLADLPFVTLVDDKADADLIWSADGRVEHVVGGVVAENVDGKSLKPILSKWAALKWLAQQAALNPLPAKLATGNQRYVPGDVVQVEIEGAKYPHLTMFNLPPDGRVEFFIPDPNRPAEARKDWSREVIHEKFKVDKPPFGAEHIVAIFSKEGLSDLHAVLASMKTPEAAEALRPALEQALAGQETQIGIIDVYTGAGG